MVNQRATKTRRGRGALPRADVAADVLVTFRATHAERERYQRAAAEAGVTFATWIRALCDGASTAKPRQRRK